MIFDTHCHAYWHDLVHRQEEVRSNMVAAGVVRSVQIGTDLVTSRQALALAHIWGDDTWCTVGVHPSECQDLPKASAQETLGQYEKLIDTNVRKIVAVGETGLDYYHLTRGCEEEQIRTQKAFFREQARLALRLNLPLVIHTRNASDDILALIKKCEVRRAVIHCFSENLEFARELLAWSDGIYFSFSGVLTYRNAVSVQEAARSLPLERILVETDAPFLVPQAVRDRYPVNEPAFTRFVMDFLKSLRSEPADVVEQTVWHNSNEFYRIK